MMKNGRRKKTLRELMVGANQLLYIPDLSLLSRNSQRYKSPVGVSRVCYVSA